LVDSGEVPRSWDGADLCPRDTEQQVSRAGIGSCAPSPQRSWRGSVHRERAWQPSASPKIDTSGDQPLGVLLVDCLPSNTERLGPLILRFLPFTAQSL